MNNRQYLESLSNYDLAQQNITYHRSAIQSYYMTSDDTMFDFTDSDWSKAWTDALNYEINWLQSERKEG